MTIPEILDEVALRIDDPSRKRLDNLIVTRLLSRAQEAVSRRTFCLRVLHEITTEEGRSAHPLPARFLREYSVTGLSANGQTMTIKPANRRDSHGARPTDIPNQIYYYLESGRNGEPGHNIVFWPAYPRDDDTVEVWCAVASDQIIEGKDALELPEECHQAVLWQTIADVAELPRAVVDDRIRQRWRIRAEQEMRGAIAAVSRTVGTGQAVIYPL